MIRVFIADDHPIVLRGLTELFAECADIAVVGTATSGREALASLDPGRPAWDVLLLDLSLPRVGGAEVLRRVREQRPDAKVIIVSMYPEEQHAGPLLAAGASLYFSKARPAEELLDEVRRVFAGGAEAPRAPAPEAGKAPHLRLSTREYQVFMLLVEGQSVAEIAAQLDVLSSTVSNHVARIREKLDARTVADIVTYAHRAGLVD
ncbi:MAG: response regulator transcription factor [Polyangiales bacterium]